MRVGVPVWGDRVSPVLDTAERLVVVEFGGEAKGTPGAVGLPAGPVPRRAAAIADLGLDVLICGALTRTLADMLVAAGVKVVPWVSGGVEEVLRAFTDGALGDGRFAMPGCGCGRGQGRKRQVGSGGRGRGMRRRT